MTRRQERFVAEYLVDLNATQAAIRAGYSRRTANREGTRLLSNAVISEEIARRQDRHLREADLRAQRVLQELQRVAFADIRTFYDSHGSLKSVSELSADSGAQLAGVETLVTRQVVTARGKQTVHKIRLWDKLRALELLAKHFELLGASAGGSDLAEFIARLERARMRLDAAETTVQPGSENLRKPEISEAGGSASA